MNENNFDVRISLININNKQRELLNAIHKEIALAETRLDFDSEANAEDIEFLKKLSKRTNEDIFPAVQMMKDYLQGA